MSYGISGATGLQGPAEITREEFIDRAMKKLACCPSVLHHNHETIRAILSLDREDLRVVADHYHTFNQIGLTPEEINSMIDMARVTRIMEEPEHPNKHTSGVTGSTGPQGTCRGPQGVVGPPGIQGITGLMGPFGPYR